MATEIPGAVESGPSEFTQTLHDVTTDKSIALLGNMHGNRIQNIHNSTIHYGKPATIQGKFERCREALLVSDPDLDREALISAKGKRAPGTCEWIVEDPHYKSWLAREFPILQISGRPGTGKTMLSLFLTEKLAERCGQENEQLLFFYCRFQDERFNNRQNVLRNIICQLLEFSKPDCQQVKDVLRDFESPKKTNDILSSFEALWGIVKKLLSQPGLPTIWCIIDGMDECQSFEKLQGELYDYCRACGQQDGESKLQLLILGRQNDDYNASHVIKLDEDHQNRIKNDVECFIISGLEPLERIPEFAQIRDDVTRMLFEKAEGTFLWVGFVIAELRGKQNCIDIMDTVESFPKGLNPTFARMLPGIDHKYHQASASVLKWILFAKRPLTINELAAATAEAAGGRHSEANANFTAYIIRMLKPLLQVENDKVLLVHQSAKEYFMGSEQVSTSPLNGYCFLSDQCHGVIAQSCLQIIQETYKHQNPHYLSQFPLFDYAKLNWVYHTRQSATCPDDITRPFFDDLVQEKKTMILEGHYSFPLTAISIIPSIHEASKFGIARLLESIHRHANGYWKKNINLRTTLAEYGQRMRPLERAILGGDERTIKFLLDHGADCQNSMRDGFFVAALAGQPDTIRLLFEHGLTFDFTIKKKAQFFLRSAYYGAPSYRYNGLLKCYTGSNYLRLANSGSRSLIDGFEPWWFDITPHPTIPLHCIVGSGDKTLIQAVLDHGAVHIDARDRAGMTALNTAVQARKLSAVEFLLKRGANIDVADHGGRTPLMSAVEMTSAKMVRYLVAQGANIEAKDVSEETALIKAILLRDEVAVECLLNHGADTSGIARSNIPLVLSAAEHGSVQILTFLLANGAAVDWKDRSGVTPLICALVRWREPKFDLSNYCRPGLYLHLTEDWYHERKDVYHTETIIESLLNYGADPRLCGRVYLHEPGFRDRPSGSSIHGWLEDDAAWVVLDAPPVLCAASIGLDWAIELLIQRGADCNATATEWYLPNRKRNKLVAPLIRSLRDFHLYVGYNYYGGIRAMIISCIPRNPMPSQVRPRQAGSALVYASIAGNLTTVRLLLSLGADTRIEDGFGMTALAWARKKGLEAGTETRRKVFDEIAGVLEAHDEGRT